MTIAHGPKLLPLQDKGSWYSSRNTSAYLQQVGTKLWVRESTQLDLPDMTKIKDTKESWQTFWWGSWLICKKAFLSFEESFQGFASSLIFINLPTTFAPVLE
jgi:hypothetical protein